MERLVPDPNETSRDQSLESFGTEVINFLLCAVFLNLRNISVTWSISQADLYMIYSKVKHFLKVRSIYL